MGYILIICGEEYHIISHLPGIVDILPVTLIMVKITMKTHVRPGLVQVTVMATELEIE